MSALYILGIGGSGAKVCEALIHLLVAGLRSGDIELNFLDQDTANGNLNKTKRALDLYKSLRDGLRDSFDSVGNDQLFKAEINPKNETNPKGEIRVWPPVYPPFERFGNLFQRDQLREEARHFFDCLYDGEAEVEMELVHGFRGRPALGQAALAAGLDTGLAFWTDLNKKINYVLNTSVDSQKFFLVGSMFGGTGAAGVPTVARHLRRRLHGEGGRKAGGVGGALLLPYFEYPRDGAEEHHLPSPSSMMARTRMALEYYRLEMNPAARGDIDPKYPLGRDIFPGRNAPLLPQFDALYVVGWPEMITFPNISPGGREQLNPPLMPELLAALAALHFGQDRLELDNQVYRAGYVGASEGQTTAESVDWEDLPSPVDRVSSPRALRRLAGLVRFAFAYKYIYFEALFGEDAKSYGNQIWFKNLLGERDVITPVVHKIGTDLLEYCDILLRWAVSLVLHGQAVRCNLFDIKEFADYIEERSAIGQPLPRRIVLYEEMKGRQSLLKGSDNARYLPFKHFKNIDSTFDKLVVWDTPFKSLKEIYTAMCTARVDKSSKKGLPVMLHFLWVACCQEKEERF